jgi:hypothetical protein
MCDKCVSLRSNVTGLDGRMMEITLPALPERRTISSSTPPASLPREQMCLSLTMVRDFLQEVLEELGLIIKDLSTFHQISNISKIVMFTQFHQQAQNKK